MIRTINLAVSAIFLLLALLAPNIAQATVIDDIVEKIYEMTLDEKELNCLAKNIYYESRGEPNEGMVAVGVVTLNRVEHPQFPDTICDVVHQRTKSKDGKTVCQFSWSCMRLKVPKETDPLWLESLTIAKNLLLGKYQEFQLKYINAHFFHNVSVNPGWNLRKVARIGSHIFYR